MERTRLREIEAHGAPSAAVDLFPPIALARAAGAGAVSIPAAISQQPAASINSIHCSACSACSVAVRCVGGAFGFQFQSDR